MSSNFCCVPDCHIPNNPNQNITEDQVVLFNVPPHNHARRMSYLKAINRGNLLRGDGFAYGSKICSLHFTYPCLDYSIDLYHHDGVRDVYRYGIDPNIFHWMPEWNEQRMCRCYSAINFDIEDIVQVRTDLDGTNDIVTSSTDTGSSNNIVPPFSILRSRLMDSETLDNGSQPHDPNNRLSVSSSTATREEDGTVSELSTSNREISSSTPHRNQTRHVHAPSRHILDPTDRILRMHSGGGLVYPNCESAGNRRQV